MIAEKYHTYKLIVLFELFGAEFLKVKNNCSFYIIST